MNVLRHFLLFCLLSVLTACSTSDFFLGKDNHPPARSLPKVTNALSTAVFWQQQVGNTGAEEGLALQPAFLNDLIYTVSADGILKAFNVENGNQVLKVNLNNDISSGIAVYGDHIFVGTTNGSLLAVRASDGKPLWRQPLSGMMLAAPVVADSLVLARSIDGTLTAFDWRTGEKIWRYHGSEPTLSIRGNARPVVGGGVVILTTDNGYFVVLDERTGLPVLEKRITSGIGSDPVSRLVDMDTTPKINRGILYGAAYQSMVFAIDLQAGQPLWRQSNASTPKDIALNDRAIFIVNDIDHVIAIDQQDGNILWENNNLEGRYLSPPFVLPSGLVGVLDKEGYLHWLNGNTGSIIGQKKLTAGGATTTAKIYGGRIFWQLNNGKIISFRPEKI